MAPQTLLFDDGDTQIMLFTDRCAATDNTHVSVLMDDQDRH